MAGLSDRTFRASQTYIWRTIDNLGNGAFGSVYKGFHKKSGQAVAIKTFNAKFMMTPQHLQQHARELEILQGLDHPNIVKLVCVEEEVKHRPALGGSHQDMVLVMELATHGSLYSIIDLPENSCGLRDAELLLIMKHLAAGLKHMRDNSVLHRDVKPSNILKTVTETGEVLYKLCDFGAARVLAENEPFQSIVGTEEYLHPAIYDRALLGGTQNQFSANCDLWSIGATLYHLASGQLPFRPFGGSRGNKTTMFQMTGKKPAGVISGVQLAKNGEIQYHPSLPSHCQLSNGLNSLLSIMLQKLMEIEKSRQWSFEKFFWEVAMICQSVPVFVFNATTARSGTLYIPPEKLSRDVILGGVSSQLTGVKSEDVSVFWNGRDILNCDESEFTRELKYQNTDGHPLIVVQKSESLKQLSPPSIPKELAVTGLSDQLNVEVDVEAAKRTCTLSYWVKRELKAIERATHLLRNLPSHIVLGLRERVMSVEQGLCSAKKVWKSVLIHLDALSLCAEMSGELKGIVDRKENSGEQISATASHVESAVLGIKSGLISLRTESALNSIPFEESKTEESNSVNSVRLISELTDEIFMQFKKDRSMKIDSTSVNEANWHLLKKRQLVGHLLSLEKTLKEADFEASKSVHQSVSVEMRKLLDISNGLKKIEADLEGLTAMIDAFQETVSQVHRNHMDRDHRSPGSGVRNGKILDQTLKTSNLENSINVSEVTSLVMKAVEATQDVRSTAQKNTQLLQELFGS